MTDTTALKLSKVFLSQSGLIDIRLELRLVNLNNDLHIITWILFDINDGCRRFINGDDLCQDLLDINSAAVDEA